MANSPGNEGDVVRGIGRERRAGLRDANRNQESRRSCRGKTFSKRSGFMSSPRVGEICMDGRGIRSHGEPEHDEGEKRADFGDSEDILYDPAVLETANVGESDQSDDANSKRLRGRERNCVVR